MARATGVDLTEAMQDGDITSAAWAQMVTNCRGCTCPGHCSETLAALEVTDQRTDAPSYCENRATFDRLAGHPA